MVIIDETSTSCSGRPVVQSKSLRVGSSRQEAQTPLPAAHRKRTCCSLRCDTVNDLCNARKRSKTSIVTVKVHTDIQFHDRASSLYIPPLSYFGHQSSILCSSIPPRDSRSLLGNSEWAAEELCPVKVLHESEGSIHLEKQKLIKPMFNSIRGSKPCQKSVQSVNALRVNKRGDAPEL